MLRDRAILIRRPLTREIRLPARFNLKNGDRNDFTGFRVVRKVDTT